MYEWKNKNAIHDAEVHFFRHADPETIQNILRECNSDIAEYTRKRGEALVKIQFLAKAAANKQRDEKLLQLASCYREAIEKNIEKPIQFLRSLMGQKASAAFNNSLDKLSHEEIIELIRDQNLVNLIDQLEQDGTDNESQV